MENEKSDSPFLSNGIFQFQPRPCNIAFHNTDGEIGKLSWGSGKLEFSGNIEESAKALFEFLKEFVDGYINEKLKSGR